MNRSTQTNQNQAYSPRLAAGWLTGRMGVMACVALIALMLSSCGGTSPRRYVEVHDSRSEQAPLSPSEERPVEIAPVSQVPPEPTPRPMADTDNLGWLITQPDTMERSGLLDEAARQGVTHIQLGGDILDSIDALIFDADLQERIRRFARDAAFNGIRVYIWSRELNLEGGSFRFHPADPFAAAREAAYRNAFNLIPDLDGVVLRFDDAPAPPWDAVIPPGSPDVPPAERVRFVVGLVHRAVVEQQNRRLILHTGDRRDDSFNWIASALQQLPGAGLAVHAPSQLFDGMDLDGKRQTLNRFGEASAYIQLDAVGAFFGGPEALYCVSEEAAALLPLWEARRVGGVVGRVDSPSGSVFNTPNEINLAVLRAMNEPAAFSDRVIVEDWLRERYGAHPSSPEGLALARLFRDSPQWAMKSVYAKRMVPFSFEAAPNRPLMRTSMGRDDARLNELSAPFPQTMRDLAQESFEAIERIDLAIHELQQVQGAINQQDFESLRRSLSFSRDVANLFQYGKQARWGAAIWGAQMNEREALYLEANLQKLAEHAQAIRTPYSAGGGLVSRDTVTAFERAIRADFPRVIMGWRDRQWNRVREMSVRQIGPDSVELTWKTDRPSTTTAFAARALPNFELSVNASTFPETEHRCQFRGLRPGERYYFKVHCRDEDNEITFSGEFPITLEPPSPL